MLEKFTEKSHGKNLIKSFINSVSRCYLWVFLALYTVWMVLAWVLYIDEENLKEAEFNEKELRALKTFASSAKEAKAFAKQAGLKSQQVPYIEPTDGN